MRTMVALLSGVLVAVLGIVDDCLIEIGERNALFLARLLEDGEEDRQDGDHDDQVDEAIAKPLGIQLVTRCMHSRNRRYGTVKAVYQRDSC